MLALAERLRGPGPRLPLARREPVLRGRDVPGLRRAVREHARRAPGRPSRRGRAGQARPAGLRAVEGRRARVASCAGPAAGARASRAGTSSARRWPCKHLGERFDIHTGGEDNVFPHHEDEIAQSAPIVGGPPADVVDPRRPPAHERPEDVEVRRATSSGSPSWPRRASTRSRSGTCA